MIMSVSISRKSWHYRWVMFSRESVGRDDYGFYPSSICSYFWSFVWATIVFAYFWGGISLLIAGFPISIWSAFHNHSQIAFCVFWVYMVIIGLLLIIYLITALSEYQVFRTKRKACSPIVNKSISFFRIVAEVLLAGKKKICPLVKYED
jgi:hypothetical protein